MMKNTCKKLFRTSVFGGYKKKDVREYIEKLEQALAEMEKRFLERKEDDWDDWDDWDPSAQESWLTYEMKKDMGGKELGNVIIFGDDPEN